MVKLCNLELNFLEPQNKRGTSSVSTNPFANFPTPPYPQRSLPLFCSFMRLRMTSSFALFEIISMDTHERMTIIYD